MGADGEEPYDFGITDEVEVVGQLEADEVAVDSWFYEGFLGLAEMSIFLLPLIDIDDSPSDGKPKTCTMRCNVHPIDGTQGCTPRVTGYGAAPTCGEAESIAFQEAASRVPQGCYKRHCHCVPPCA